MIENFWGEHGQKWVCQSGDGTLKLTVFEEWTDGIYELIFCLLIHDQIFYVIALWKMSVASLVTGRKDEQMESSHFFMLVQIQES